MDKDEKEKEVFELTHILVTNPETGKLQGIWLKHEETELTEKQKEIAKKLGRIFEE